MFQSFESEDARKMKLQQLSFSLQLLTFHECDLTGINPEYITNENGEKLSVVLSVEEFEAILEDYEDLAIVAERKDESSISHDKLLEELKTDELI